MKQQRTTIRDVAARAGVSPAAVSSHINDKGRMGGATRERIQAAIEDLQFTPNGLIRALQNRRTHVLGLLIGGLESLQRHPDDAYTMLLLSGIYEAADRAQQDIMLFTGWPNRPERMSGREFLDGRVDGLLWLAPPLQSVVLNQIAGAGGLPVMAMLTRHVPGNVGYVNADNLGGARAVIAHLVGLGHRRIAFAGPVQSSNFLDRFDGYRNGLDEAGIPFDSALAVTDSSLPFLLETTDDLFVNMLKNWRALPEPPTAVFVCTDRWAARLGKVAIEQGLRIPEDLSVVGFDDAVLAERVFGGLTTVRQPFEDIGRLCVDHLLRLIDGEAAEDCSVTCPVTLMARASSAQPRRI
ncbi:MAG: LacI family DNA-binding transcriptional regulator [Fibrella sp.]|nr:LacI family DNA-binding transcriptional regulator [Armatimonadota bacterium]